MTMPYDQWIDRQHMIRMWPERHEPVMRESVRDNLRAQRGAKRYAQEHPEAVRWVKA